MWTRAIETSALTFFAAVAGVAFAIGVAADVFRKRGRADMVLRGLEAAVLAALGGFLARLFIGVLLAAAGDSPAACLTVGWACFPWRHRHSARDARR
jgi:hypothetical protein